MTPVFRSCGLAGSRLRRFAEKYLDQSTVELIALPIIADLQHENSAEPRTCVTWSLVLLRGYWSFWKAIGLQTVIGGDRKMRTIKFIGIDALTFVLLLVAAFFLTRPGYLVSPDRHHSMIFWSVQLLCCLAGLAIALAFRVRLTAYCIASLVAFTVSEMVAQAFYSPTMHVATRMIPIEYSGVKVSFITRVFSASVPTPIHFAVMGAAMLGVAFGAGLTLWGARLAFRNRMRSSPPEMGNP
ncbi:MAG: hypothetical protein LAP85_14735 [Acidobacteriia bacterium]|nr:hypothetical protein [Terriglobia bacterium]